MEEDMGANDVLDDLISEAVTQENCNNKCIDIAKCIENRDSELFKLVEKLQPYLTDKDPARRERGTHILADVLGHIPPEFLQESELIIVANFFCDRLKDNAAVIPNVLQGILAMAEMKNLPRDAPPVIVRMIFQHIQCDTLKQHERNNIYKLFRILISEYSEELLLLGEEFVLGLMTMIDGERDPRNLLLVFNMLPHFLRTFPLGALTEDMFDVMSCYYPIDFFSNPSDPNRITRDSLAAALQPCLTALPDFAEFCIPLLLEKLDSDRRTAKLDSLKLLQGCCKTFTFEGIEKYLDGLYGSLKRELFAADDEINKEALTALKQLVHMLTSAPIDQHQASQIHTMLNNIVQEGIHHMNDVALGKFFTATHILIAVAEASPIACKTVIMQVVPALVNQFHKSSTDAGGKVILLQTLSTFVAVCEVTPTSDPELSTLWEDISNVYMTSAQLDIPQVKKEGIHGFIIVSKSVQTEIRSALYDLICNIVKTEDSTEVRQEAVTCLKEFSRIYPDEVMEQVVFSKLHSSKESGDASIEFRCVSALCEVAVVEPFTTCIVPQILDFVAGEPQTEKCVTGIKCLRKLIEMPDAGPKLHKYLYVECAAVARLVSWWIQGLSTDTHSDIFHSKDLLIDSAKVINTILRTQSNSIQSEVVREFTPRFMETHGNIFRPLDVTAPRHQTQAVLLLEALLSPLHQDVMIPQLSELITKLKTLSTGSADPLTSRCAARLVACFINKAQDNEYLNTLLCDLMSQLVATSDNALTLFSWITKSLVMRGHEAGQVWTENLINFLNDKAVGSEAADGFRLIMSQEEEHNYCNVRWL
ncbi:hypothetical protein L9F63_023833, partial [Diploptera punctata]